MSSTERQLPEVGEEIHLPGGSAQPLVVAIASTIMLIGITNPSPVIFLFGTALLAVVLFLWIRDAIAEFKALPESHDHAHEHHDEGDTADAH